MNIEKGIESRRSIYPKMFSGEVVPEEIISKMLEMANWAPTHRNTEPWRFKVFAGKEKIELIELLKELYIKTTPAEKFNSKKLVKMEERKKQVSHIVAICMERNEIVPEFEEIASTAMAVQNMWLFLSSEKKHGGYWSTPAYAFGEEIRKHLKLRDSERCLGLFYIGSIESGSWPIGNRSNWEDKVRYMK